MPAKSDFCLFATAAAAAFALTFAPMTLLALLAKMLLVTVSVAELLPLAWPPP